MGLAEAAVKGVHALRPRSAAGWLAVALALATAAAAAQDPRGLVRFVLGFAYRGPLVDVEAWQEWADANRGFFGPLRPGARFAVVEDIEDSTGVVFTRTESGLVADKTHWLRFSPPPVVLALKPQTAAEIQVLRLGRDQDRFWDAFKNVARRRLLRSYRFVAREEMERLGLVAFLRSFDVYDPDDSPPPH
jgi:hypothetical protein